jgi:hypothetical protein
LEPFTNSTESRVSNTSGKLVILAILAVAVVAAGTSWWFRYKATRRAAEFWGAEGSQLIRDAPVVLLGRRGQTADISQARGLTHLRNALLEDRSFNWDSTTFGKMDNDWAWALTFHDAASNKTLTIAVFNDFRCIAPFEMNEGVRPISCEPIAAGLREMFAELVSDAPQQQR